MIVPLFNLRPNIWSFLSLYHISSPIETIYSRDLRSKFQGFAGEQVSWRS